MSETHVQSDALAAASERRVELKDAVSRVERAAASPSGSPMWRPGLLAELDTLKVALDQHVAEVEGENGLLPELLAEAPRLANKINKIRDEHPGLCRQAVETIGVVRDSDDAEAARSAVLDLLVAVARHRQRGADLVYEGYSVDIGGGD